MLPIEFAPAQELRYFYKPYVIRVRYFTTNCLKLISLLDQNSIAKILINRENISSSPNQISGQNIAKNILAQICNI